MTCEQVMAFYTECEPKTVYVVMNDIIHEIPNVESYIFDGSVVILRTGKESQYFKSSRMKRDISFVGTNYDMARFVVNNGRNI